MRQTGCVIWFTGLSGTGKSTLAQMLRVCLRNIGKSVEVLDGDVIRAQFSRDLGFSREDRVENCRRLGFLCEMLERNGVIAIVAAISPYRAARQEVRDRICSFIEVFVYCPLEILIKRDPKELYRKALAGEILHFSGVSDPYEPPLAPSLTVNSALETPLESLAKIWDCLRTLQVIPQAAFGAEIMHPYYRQASPHHTQAVAHRRWPLVHNSLVANTVDDALDQRPHSSSEVVDS